MAATTGARLLVITGGEPFLQDAVLTLLRKLETLNVGAHFDVYQFETNGTMDKFSKKLLSLTDEHSIILEKLSVCVSPKANMLTRSYAKIPPNMAKLAEFHGFYKFVVSADPDDPHHKIPEPFLDMAAEGLVRVYASPAAVYKKAPVGEVSSVWDSELVDQEATARNYLYAAQYVLRNPGLLLSLQTHLFTSVP
jgi:organic radical activating enzyme